MVNVPGLLVVGTDTGVGKTQVTAAVARTLVGQGRRVGVLKPVATGAMRSGDVLISEDGERLMEAIGGGVPADRVVPLVFEEALAPSVAARRRGSRLEQGDVLRAVQQALLWWAERAEIILVEGVGGLLCPLAEGTTVADLAVALDFPLVIVARRGLGTLNHTLLTVEAAQSRGLRIAGVLLNSTAPDTETVADATNAEELARRIVGIAIIAELGYLDDPATMATRLGSLDWYERARACRWVGSAPGARARESVV